MDLTRLSDAKLDERAHRLTERKDEVRVEMAAVHAERARRHAERVAAHEPDPDGTHATIEGATATASWGA